MKRPHAACAVLCVLVMTGLLAACGGSAASGQAGGETIQGIATPSGVAVVTATNVE